MIFTILTHIYREHYKDNKNNKTDKSKYGTYVFYDENNIFITHFNTILITNDAIPDIVKLYLKNKYWLKVLQYKVISINREYRLYCYDFDKNKSRVIRMECRF